MQMPPLAFFIVVAFAAIGWGLYLVERTDRHFLWKVYEAEVRAHSDLRARLRGQSAGTRPSGFTLVELQLLLALIAAIVIAHRHLLP